MASRSWLAKFRAAFQGLWLAVRSERSFAIHLPVAAAVIATGILLRVDLVEWCLLGLCITVVIAAEAFNTSIERLARATRPDHDPLVGAALDMASGAVLACAIGTSLVGGAIFVYRLGIALRWWHE